MAISVYTGVMGSGKSYEAIKNGIIPAIKAGRRVVTNISGVNSDKIRDYLVSKGSKIETLGHVLHVTNEAVLQPGFFPGEGKTRLKFDVPDFVPLPELQHYAEEYAISQGKNFTKTAFQLLLPELKKLKEKNIHLGSCLVAAAHREWKGFQAEWFYDKSPNEIFAELPDNGPSIVQPGDFVVIDEGWRYWSDNDKLTGEHMNFFRMHRHYISGNGTACDLLVIIQDFGSLNRFLRGVCELVLIFSKLKVFGLSNRYRVEVYEGRPRKTTLVSTSPWQKYDREIFPLYLSYDGHGGKENKTDDRQNLFHNKWFLASMFVGLLLVGFGGKWFYSYVGKLRNGGQAKFVSTQDLKESKTASDQSSVLGTPPVSDKTPVNDVRLVAVLDPSYGEVVVIFQLSDGRFVRRHMTAGSLDGWQSVAGYDGKMAGFYFGSSKGK